MTPAVRAILIATGAAFLVQIITGNKIAGYNLELLFGVNAADFRPWQLLTATFLHSTTNIFHIAFNMLWLWMLGKDVERSIGAKKFLALYLIGGVSAGLCWLAFQLLTRGHAVAVGASGAVFAVMVAYAILYPDRRFFVFKAKHFVTALIALEVILSVTGSKDGIAHVAHVGGAAFGLAFFKTAPAWNAALVAFRGRRRKTARRDDARTRAKVDALLEKISSTGLDSLSAREKAFLKKASRRLRQNRGPFVRRNHEGVS